MVRKMHKEAGSETKSATQFSETIRESAQQIWLAGLGAFSKAQEEGGKVFDALVKEGMSMHRKTQSAAEEKFADASTRMASMASEISSKASGQWDKLENIFEDRVSRALKKLGVPASQDIDALVARIDELNRHVAKLNARGTAAKSARPTAAGATKRAAKRTPSRKTAT